MESVDLLDKMSTPQVVRILCDAYQNSTYAMATMARIHEISRFVSLACSSLFFTFLWSGRHKTVLPQRKVQCFLQYVGSPALWLCLNSHNFGGFFAARNCIGVQWK